VPAEVAKIHCKKEEHHLMINRNKPI
jgi:hypothetical protein